MAKEKGCLTLTPLIKAEYCDGTHWFPIATEDYVNAAVAASGGGGSDTFQTLSFLSSITWNLSSGNIATLTLTGDTTLTPVFGTCSKGTLIVKQDATGGRKLSVPVGIYRSGTASNLIALSTAANAVDMLEFKKDGSGNIYLTNLTTGFLQTVNAPPTPFVQIMNPFGSATSVTQAQLQGWYDSYDTLYPCNASPDLANPKATYSGLSVNATGDFNLWLGANTWYYTRTAWGSTWATTQTFPKGNWAAQVSSIARGLIYPYP